MLGATEGAAVGRRGDGYVAAVVGTVSGVGVGAGVGQLLGVPAGLWAANTIEVETDSSGIEAVIQLVGLMFLAFSVMVMAFLLTVVLVSWVGAVFGCGLALRITNQPHARRTALAVGAIGPPVVLLLFALIGSSRGGAAVGAFAAAAGLSAIAGRRLVLAFPR